MGDSRYRRVLLKLSGEVLASKDGGRGLSQEGFDLVSSEIEEAHRLGVQLGVVVGGGNILRGRKALSELGIDKLSADYMGMLATLINAIALRNSLGRRGIEARVMSAVNVVMAEPYSRERALEWLTRGEVLLFGGGTGNPCFTTDTAAALRAVEIGAELVLKGTKVDGIYPSDPLTSSRAPKYEELSYQTILEKNLGVMDLTAVSLCMENRMPIIVFNITRDGNLKRALLGEKVGTIVR